HPRHQHGQDGLAFRARLETEQTIKLEPAHRAQGGSDMAVRTGALDGELGGWREAAIITLEHGLERLDLCRWPLAEIGQGPFADPAALAPGLAQEDGRGELRLGTVSTYMALLYR